MNCERGLYGQEWLATLLLLSLLPGSANHPGVPGALVPKSGGLALPYLKRRREGHVYILE